MEKYLKRISCEFKGYDEDQTEYVTYYGEPFTGVLFEEIDGTLRTEEAVFKGTKTGFTISYDENGRVDQIIELQAMSPVGILARWDENGTLTLAEKRWYGEIVEELILENGAKTPNRKMTDQRMHEIQTSVLSNMYVYRQESVEELLAEAEEKIRTGTVFDDPRLLT